MASSSRKREPQDDWEIKPPILKKHKVVGFAADSLQPRVETKSDRISVKEVAPLKKNLYVGHFSRQIKISDIINFFKDVGQVVRVKLIVNRKGAYAGYGFVEFSSAHQANKALEKKNGQHFYDRDIFLGVPKRDPFFPRPKYWIDHKVVWYEDYLRRESLLIEDDLETKSEDKETTTELFAQANLISVEQTEEGVDPDFVEEVDVRKKTLFVANLSPQTKLSDIINFFAQAVSVRLIVNHEGKHVGCGFVEFASANEAKKALEKKNGEYLHDHKIFLGVAKIAPYPPRSKYNLAEKLWYEDYLRRDSLLVEEDDMETVEGLVEEVSVRKKTLNVANLSPKTEISEIINFFKDVGEVVHVRLVVDHKGKHAGEGFVEFASADEAKKALKKKNGEKLQDREISLGAANIVPYTQRPMYCIDHKVWYEDYLRRESLLVEEDDMETVEGLVEEVAVREKTIFVANLPPETELSDIHNLFRHGGQVVSVQLIVDQEGKHVGCAFVVFASAEEANLALEKKKQGRGLFLDVVEIAPYPLRPKFNLAEKLWKKMIEENQQDIEEEDEDEYEYDFEPIPRFCGTKTIFVDAEEAF